jgi:hypothetical protein
MVSRAWSVLCISERRQSTADHQSATKGSVLCGLRLMHLQQVDHGHCASPSPWEGSVWAVESPTSAAALAAPTLPELGQHMPDVLHLQGLLHSSSTQATKGVDTIDIWHLLEWPNYLTGRSEAATHPRCRLLCVFAERMFAVITTCLPLILGCLPVWLQRQRHRIASAGYSSNADKRMFTAIEAV